jgi:hypothetical protein
MIKRLAMLAVPLLLTGCMAANPTRPVIEFEGKGKLTYYGPQAPDPRVEMAKVITGGLSTVVGAVVQGDVIKSLSNASGATSTIERVTNNAVTDRSSDTSNTSVSDRSHTSVTDTAISDTSATSTSVTTGD